MAEKKINTRIALKIDTYENWTKTEVSGKGANLVLKRGEIGLCEIPSGNSKATTAPTVLFKVGDGETAFGSLRWASALAADVYSWAKAENVVLDGKLIKFESGTGEAKKVIKTVDLSTFALATDITTLEAADKALGGRIDGVITRVSTNEGDIKTLQDTVSTLEGLVIGGEGEGINAIIGDVSDLKTRMGTAEGEIDTLQFDLSTLTTTVESKDSAVKGLISAETTARETAINGINTKIGTVADGKDVVTMISDAKTAAEGKVTELANGTVKSNTDRIKAIEDDYLTSTDKSTLEAADSAILGKIGTVADGKTVVGLIGEAQTATQGYADEKAGAVQDNLDAHVDAYDLKVKALGEEDARIVGLVNTEKSTRETEITRVEGLITAEETTRKNAVEALQTKIDNINTNIASGLHFVGVVKKLEDITSPANGDICIVGTQEYIYVKEENKDGRWEPLGEANAHATYEYVNTELGKKADKATYEAKVEALEAEDAAIRKAFAEADTALQTAIDGKVAQGDFNTLSGTVSGLGTSKLDKSVYDAHIEAYNDHITAQEGIDAAQDAKIKAIEDSVSSGAINTRFTNVETLAQKGVDDAKAAQDDIDELAGKVGTISGEKTLVEQLAAVKATADAAAVKETVEAEFDRVDGELAKKVDKDGYIAFTQAEKDKLAGIAAGANNYELPVEVVKDANYATRMSAVESGITTEKGRAEAAELALSNRVKVFEDKFGGAEDILVFDCGSSTTVI